MKLVLHLRTILASALRTKTEDIEGNFCRHWLLHDLLECYFKIRDQWYLGPKESFKWLKKNDEKTYQIFDAAVKT